MRPDQILVRTVEPLDERRGHVLLSGAHHDGFGADEAAAASICAAGWTGLVLEQCGALAVNRDIDIFESRVRARHNRHFEHVFAVGWKHVIHDDTAAGPVGGAVDMIPGVL